MIFVMCSATLDWLTSLGETNKLKREEEQERLVKEEEAAEFKKFEGTRVTIETFIAWKASFDAEGEPFVKKTNDNLSKKLTGKIVCEDCTYFMLK